MVAFRPGRHVEAGVLIVVEPIALNEVVGTAEQVEAVREPRRGLRVSTALVALDRRPAGPPGQRDPVIAVVRNQARRDVQAGAARGLDAEAKREALGEAEQLDAMAPARDLDY